MTIVTLTTDFGLSDPFVGIVKGVLLARAPGATIVDVTHGIPPQDVLAGALVLRQAVPFFPAGTIHVAVVDPGVGTSRRPLCVETSRGLLVGPDNGLLSLAAPRGDLRRVVHVTAERFFLSPRSTTFHGRDVFAPVAAALASGTSAAELGTEVADMERLGLPSPTVEARRIRGQVIYVDHFGNLVTNIDGETLARLEGTPSAIVVGGMRIPGIAASYAAVPTGSPLSVLNSWGLLEVAVRDSSALKHLGAGVGESVVVES
jgi:S-adenosylmethionine hydrolase